VIRLDLRKTPKWACRQRQRPCQLPSVRVVAKISCLNGISGVADRWYYNGYRGTVKREVGYSFDVPPGVQKPNRPMQRKHRT
jgi:hypothetical protein